MKINKYPYVANGRLFTGRSGVSIKEVHNFIGTDAHSSGCVLDGIKLEIPRLLDLDLADRKLPELGNVDLSELGVVLQEIIESRPKLNDCCPYCHRPM